MPHLHYIADGPQFTCPAEGWVLRPATANMIDGTDPIVCPTCGWTFGPEDLTSPDQVITDTGDVDIGANVIVVVPEGG